jgi:hypothetical protein
MNQIHKHKSNDVFSRDIGKIGIDIKGIKQGDPKNNYINGRKT